MKYIDLLLKEFPEFQASKFYLESDEKESAYTVFYDFTKFLLDMIESDFKNNNVIIDRAFNFLNTMLNSNDSEQANLAGVGVLEYLVESVKAVDIAKSKLIGNAQIVLTDILEESKK